MIAAALARPLIALGRATVDAMLPPRCLVCRTGVDAQGALCVACWSRLTFIAGPVCACCGLPFAHEIAPGALCGACARRQPAFDRARAALVYDEASRGLILGFKHGDRTEAAPALARWLIRAGPDLIAAADLIAPVPLHRSRLLSRRYNQAALIVNAIDPARSVPDLLERRRRTPSQGGLNARERRLNVRGAFGLRPRHAERVAGRRILLIDDVHTTGATLEACARTLKRGGAVAVDTLCVARVVGPAEVSLY